jgi:hypothetical protein
MMSEANNIPFPHAVLTPLPNERPTASTLELLQQELSANAISVPSARGNGSLGHYALVVSNAKYVLAEAVAFDPPVSPGVAPVHPPQGTAAQITEINRQFLADQREYHLYSSTEAKLKQQLLMAVPNTYTNALKDKFVGFANVTTLQILTHLNTDYGAITTDDLDANMKLLHKEWSPAHPIEDLFEQIWSCREFAINNDPISEQTAVRAALANLEASGLFGDAIRDWRKRPTAEKTLVNFTMDFKQADAERQRQQTTKAAGYQEAAAAVTTHIIHFANVTTIDTKSANQLYYCWTNGAGPNPNHTSQNCNGPIPGHRHEATIVNMLGGNNLIHRKRGEIQVYVPPHKKPKRYHLLPPAEDEGSQK